MQAGEQINDVAIESLRISLLETIQRIADTRASAREERKWLRAQVGAVKGSYGYSEG